MKNRTHASIGILAYPEAQASAVHGLTDLFLVANRIENRRASSTSPALKISHWEQSPDSGHVRRSYSSADGDDQRLNALIVPPRLGYQGKEEFNPRIVRWIRKQHEGGAVVCSICVGAFLLGQAGLLSGRPATTHWALKEEFAARFPDVALETDKLIIDDGDVITAGGIMAWVDLGLRIIDRFVGSSIMLEVARFFLVDPGGREQRFYSPFAPRLYHCDESILNVQHWLQANYKSSLSIAAMASVAGLSERTFLRRFKKATDLNPTAYLQTLRVGKARELLELSSQPVSKVAWEVGYSDTAAFSSVFQRIIGLSPGEYRQRFSVR